MEKSLKELHDKSNEMVSFYAESIGAKVNNITVVALLSNWQKGELHLSVNYFLTHNGHSIHKTVTAPSYEEVVAQLKLDLEQEIDQQKLKNQFAGKSDENIIIEMNVPETEQISTKEDSGGLTNQK